ncbi:MAG: hypothetical protein V1793_06560 [Pseudomonadota bacterium]
MRLATIRIHDKEHLAICLEAGLVSIRDLNRELGSQWPETMDQLLKAGRIAELGTWFRQKGMAVPGEGRYPMLRQSRASSMIILS